MTRKIQPTTISVLHVNKVTQNTLFSFPIYVLQGRDGQGKKDKTTKKKEEKKKGVTTKEL